MTTAIKRRRGTTAQHATFTGLEGELTVDTTKDTVVVHDGATAGGFPLLKEAAIGVTVQAYDADLTNWAGKTAPTGDAVGTTDTQTLTNKTISGASNTLSNIGNSSLTNSAVTIGSTSVSLGATASTIAGLTLTGAAVNGTVGASTPSTGAFTTLSASSTVTLSGGTANGVAYLNGSKVLTTGSALTFDGTKLGIGTSTPASVLQVYSTSAVAAQVGSNQATTYFQVNNSTDAAGIASTASSLLFFTGSAGSEQMRLTSTGLGIGTSSPLSKLNAKGTQGNWRIDPDSVTNEIQLFSTNTGNTGFLDFRLRTNQTIFDTNGTERMRIDSSGNLGIGTSSPSTLLHLQSATNPTIRLQDTSYLNRYINLGYTEEGGGEPALTFGISVGGGAIERMRIDSSGNLIQTVNTTAATLSTNQTMTISIVNNTTLKFSVRGSDGTTRSATLTLA